MNIVQIYFRWGNTFPRCYLPLRLKFQWLNFWTRAKIVQQLPELPETDRYNPRADKYINKKTVCVWLLQGHLRVCKMTSTPFRRTLYFLSFSGICSGCKGFKPQASCPETGEAAEKPNLASEIRPADKRRGSTQSTRHQAPVISDQSGRVLRWICPPGFTSSIHTHPTPPGWSQEEVLLAINTERGRRPGGAWPAWRKH